MKLELAGNFRWVFDVQFLANRFQSWFTVQPMQRLVTPSPAALNASNVSPVPPNCRTVGPGTLAFKLMTFVVGEVESAFSLQIKGDIPRHTEAKRPHIDRMAAACTVQHEGP